jgi:HipA-like protein
MAKWTARLGYRTPPPTLVVSYQNQAVAELTKENGKFLFRYLDPFFAQKLSALPGLPAGRDTVTSAELPAFFKERLPDTRRPEIRQYILQHKIDETDDLQMLAHLGAHSITDSFELKLRDAA